MEKNDLIFNPPKVGCVLYLPGLPGASSTIYDRSPYGSDGTISGATWGQLGSGLGYLDFDGSDDVVTATASQLNFTSGDFSIKVWAYLDAYTAPLSHIISRGLLNTDGWHFAIEPNGYLEFNTNQAAATQQSFAPDGTVTLSAWQLLHVVRKGTSVTFSRNGLPCAIGSAATHTNPLTSSRTVKIGRADDAAKWLNGRLALLRVDNFALTPLQIKEDFVQERNLVGA